MSLFLECFFAGVVVGTTITAMFALIVVSDLRRKLARYEWWNNFWDRKRQQSYRVRL